MPAVSHPCFHHPSPASRASSEGGNRKGAARLEKVNPQSKRMGPTAQGIALRAGKAESRYRRFAFAIQKGILEVIGRMVPRQNEFKMMPPSDHSVKNLLGCPTGSAFRLSENPGWSMTLKKLARLRSSSCGARLQSGGRRYR